MNIKSLISKNFRVLNSSSALEEIKDVLFLSSFVVIMDDEKYTGLLTLAGIFEKAGCSVTGSLQKDIRIESDCKVEDSLDLMEENKLPVLPVFRDGKFEGVVIYTDLLKIRKLFADNTTSGLYRPQDICLCNEHLADEFIESSGKLNDARRSGQMVHGVWDITKTAASEDSLRESQLIFKTAFELHSSLMAITTMDDGTYIDVNNAFCSTLGFKREEVIGQSSVGLKIWTSQKAREEVMSLFKKQGYLANHEVEYFAKNRERRYGLFSIASIIINNNTFLMTSMTDITGQKKLEMELEQHRNHLEKILETRSKELFESEKRYRDIINTITDYVYQVIIDSDNNIKTIHTDGCYNVTGYHSYEFSNDPDLWRNIIFDADRRAVKYFFQSIIRNMAHEQKLEHRIVHKNGSIRWINNTIIINRNPNGKTTGYDGVIKDITEKKRTENEIKRLNQHIIKLQEEERQRVAQDLHDSVGQTILAAKINIEAYLQNPDRFKEQIDVGLSFLTQASNELREIYTGLYPAILNDLGLEMAVRLLISNSIETAGISAEADIVLDTHLSHDHKVSLYRIIQEIVSNIIKHSQATSMCLALKSGNNQLKLTVKDNGIGFDPDIIYDKTAGYGLSNIKSRLESYNGTISINKNIPSGICIYISIDLQAAD